MKGQRIETTVVKLLKQAVEIVGASALTKVEVDEMLRAKIEVVR